MIVLCWSVKFERDRRIVDPVAKFLVAKAEMYKYIYIYIYTRASVVRDRLHR